MEVGGPNSVRLSDAPAEMNRPVPPGTHSRHCPLRLELALDAVTSASRGLKSVSNDRSFDSGTSWCLLLPRLGRAFRIIIEMPSLRDVTRRKINQVPVQIAPHSRERITLSTGKNRNERKLNCSFPLQ